MSHMFRPEVLIMPIWSSPRSSWWIPRSMAGQQCVSVISTGLVRSPAWAASKCAYVADVQLRSDQSSPRQLMLGVDAGDSRVIDS